MSSSSSYVGQTDRIAVDQVLRDWIIAGLVVIVSLFILYIVLIDQGASLSPFIGKAAWSANYLHEFAHDGRHLLAAPCH